MKERDIRAQAVQWLQAGGWLCWHPPKVKYHETDIFGIFDLIALHRPRALRFIQLTSLSNVSARKKKIMAFFERHEIAPFGEIWGWNKRSKKFKMIKL